MSDLKTLYDEDTVAWAENQAAALRAAARGSSNQPLDWENLAEEIEDLSKSRRLALRSELSRILQHCVKLHCSPASDPRNGWRRSIRQARLEIQRILEESPSLRRELPGFLSDEIRRAVDTAIADLIDYGEIKTADEGSAKATAVLVASVYTPEQILGDWFPPEPDKP